MSVPTRAPAKRWQENLLWAARAVSIRWRISALAILNSVLALILLAVIGSSAKRLTGAWDQLLQVRRSEQLLASLNSDAQRLQSLIHRYFLQPDPAVLSEIVERREPLISRLRVQARLDPLVGDTAPSLTRLMEAFLDGFDQLRLVRSDIAETYEVELLRSARDIAETYHKLERMQNDGHGHLRSALDESQEAFNAMLLAANSYYLSTAPEAATQAKRHVDVVIRALPAMLDRAQGESERGALTTLGRQAENVSRLLDELTSHFMRQRQLLQDNIDGNARRMLGITQELTTIILRREISAQDRFGRTLQEAGKNVAFVAVAFISAVVLLSLAISRSISDPLQHLRRAMLAIVAGDYRPQLKGAQPRDDVGDMARAVEVFRENAVAKHEAEEALRAAKERAEKALCDLREMQRTLVETEKLAALGGLVAGVAHEVNNPIGISLTVATSLARRCREFSAEMEAGPLRRSRLSEFVAGNEDAANQLEANLRRAGDLISSFKQVAVDRSDEERRRFDLAETVGQIAASVRPGLRASAVKLTVSVESGLVLDSYPGPLGQILTNLILNAVHHAFPESRPGLIEIEGKAANRDQVEITLRDDGCGMSDEVRRRAFEPFFTTRRGAGGTGLGLHIVHNLVFQLGGRITLSSAPGRGTAFCLVLPLVAPRTTPASALKMA